MFLKLNKKQLITLGGSLLVAACVSSPNPPPIVKCHQFNKDESNKIADSIEALSPTSPLIPVIEDYEGICTATK